MLGIFTFHSLPQIGGICPVPDSDVLSSQAPTNARHPGGENNKPFLGHICMCSPSCQTAALWGRRGRWSGEIVPAWSKVSSALGTDLQIFPRSDPRWVGVLILRATKK